MGEESLRPLREGNMTKYQEKSASAMKASNSEPDQASDSIPNAEHRRELKTDLRGDSESLRHEIKTLGQEINGKLDNLVAEMQSLSDRVGEAETRVEQVEGWAAEATDALCICLEQQRALKTKLKSRGPEETIFEYSELHRGRKVTRYNSSLTIFCEESCSSHRT